MTIEVFAPHLNHNIKLGGRIRPRYTMPCLYLETYLKGLPPIPDEWDGTAEAQASIVNPLLNTQRGDCVIAAGYHIEGVETGNADGGKPFVPTDPQVIADYSAIGGFDPNNPEATDNGCVIQNALGYWQQKGFCNGTKLAGYVRMNAANTALVKAACYLFGGSLQLGLELPDSFVNPFPTGNGFLWSTGTPDPQNGHSIAAPGYSTSNNAMRIVTWGLTGWLTLPGLSKLCVEQSGGELWLLITPDQINRASMRAPNHLDWPQLCLDFHKFGGPFTTSRPAPLSASPLARMIHEELDALPGVISKGQAQATISRIFASLKL